MTSSVLSSGDFPARSSKQCEDREMSSSLRERSEKNRERKEMDLCEAQKEQVCVFIPAIWRAGVFESELTVRSGDEPPLQDTTGITPALYFSLHSTHHSVFSSIHLTQ